MSNDSNGTEAVAVIATIGLVYWFAYVVAIMMVAVVVGTILAIVLLIAFVIGSIKWMIDLWGGTDDPKWRRDIIMVPLVSIGSTAFVAVAFNGPLTRYVDKQVAIAHYSHHWPTVGVIAWILTWVFAFFCPYWTVKLLENDQPGQRAWAYVTLTLACTFWIIGTSLISQGAAYAQTLQVILRHF